MRMVGLLGQQIAPPHEFVPPHRRIAINAPLARAERGGQVKRQVLRARKVLGCVPRRDAVPAFLLRKLEVARRIDQGDEHNIIRVQIFGCSLQGCDTNSEMMSYKTCVLNSRLCSEMRLLSSCTRSISISQSNI